MEDKDLEDVAAEELEKVDNAVDEISRHESDEALRNEDAKLAAAFSPATSPWGKVKHWFGIKKNQYIVAAIGVGFLALVVLVPPLKFGLLNTIGIRGSVTVTVLDMDSSLPLRNVEVIAQDQSVLTDADGIAELEGLKLGNTELQVTKLAYSTNKQEITVKSGDNSIGSVSLDPVGLQLKIALTNWLSEEPIEGGEVAYEENSVFSDVDGVALLTIPPTDVEKIVVDARASNYREEELVVTLENKDDLGVELVLEEPNYFYSNQSGDLDLFKIDLDGENREVLMLATGKEDENTQIVEFSKARALFIVSSREGKFNSDDSRLYGLFDVDSVTGDFERIDESESIRMFGISGERLIYVKVRAGTSTEDPERQKLIAYNPNSGTSLELAAANAFNSVVLTDDAVFYAVSDVFSSVKEPFMFRINPQTANKNTVHPAEVWSIFRTSYDELTFDAKQDWYKVSTLASAIPTPLSGRPNDTSTRLYQTSPDEHSAIWVDERDGKGHIVMLDVDTMDEESIYSQAGLRHPLRWVNDDHVIYRVSNDSETADYILHIGTGKTAKITDVSEVSSYDRWYYYY